MHGGGGLTNAGEPADREAPVDRVLAVFQHCRAVRTGRPPKRICRKLPEWTGRIPHRAHVLPYSGLAPHCYTLRSPRRKLPLSRRYRHNRLSLARLSESEALASAARCRRMHRLGARRDETRVAASARVRSPGRSSVAVRPASSNVVPAIRPAPPQSDPVGRLIRDPVARFGMW
jgi:hypothetical protein